MVIGPLLQSNDQVQEALKLYSEYNEPDKEVNDVTSGIEEIKLQKQKENDDDVFDLGLNNKKKQAEEAAKVFINFILRKLSIVKTKVVHFVFYRFIKILEILLILIHFLQSKLKIVIFIIKPDETNKLTLKIFYLV